MPPSRRDAGMDRREDRHRAPLHRGARRHRLGLFGERRPPGAGDGGHHAGTARSHHLLHVLGRLPVPAAIGQGGPATRRAQRPDLRSAGQLLRLCRRPHGGVRPHARGPFRRLCPGHRRRVLQPLHRPHRRQHCHLPERRRRRRSAGPGGGGAGHPGLGLSHRPVQLRGRAPARRWRSPCQQWPPFRRRRRPDGNERHRHLEAGHHPSAAHHPPGLREGRRGREATGLHGLSPGQSAPHRIPGAQDGAGAGQDLHQRRDGGQQRLGLARHCAQ